MKRISVCKTVVFINQSSGYLMIDILNQFTEEGYNCTLITGLLVERDRQLSKTVKIRRIIRYNNTNSIKRIFTWGLGTIQVFFIVLFRYHNAHLFIVSNPPIATLIPLILPNPFTLLIFDVYPDAITELGVLKKGSFIIKIWKEANKRVYLHAKDIFTITDGMKDLLKSYVPAKEIEIVHLWADNEFLPRILPEKNPFIITHNLEGKFVVLYSGNIGISNNVEVLPNVAGLVNSENITFVIIGSGARKRYLEEKIKNEGLENVMILPWQDVKNLPYSLSAASVAVVTLGKGASKLSIPSKIFSLLSIGLPVIGIGGQNSDLNDFITFHNIGKCFLPEDKEGIAQYILELANNPLYCADLSNNALQASKYFTRKNAKKFVQDGMDI